MYNKLNVYGSNRGYFLEEVDEGASGGGLVVEP
jgi:hypothetical protein